MKNINELIKLLEISIDHKKGISKHISEFQNIIWNGEFEASETQEEILNDLAHDLDYFEPNPILRLYDQTYFGKKKAIQRIKSTIEKL